MFLSSIYYNVWFHRCTTINLFVAFLMGDSENRAISIKQRNYIKFLFVSMLHQIRNLMYSIHLRITNCVSLEQFILAINIDVSSSNVFSTLVSKFRCNLLLFCINQISLFKKGKSYSKFKLI